MLARSACLGIIIGFTIILIHITYSQVYERFLFKLFLPLTFLGVTAFGFIDELFFKLKLYDPDEHNRSVIETAENVEDLFLGYRLNMSERGSANSRG